MWKDLKHFRFWCQKVLPLVYDDSISYYEVLCKLCHYLNDVIENVNSIPDYIDDAINERLSDEHIKELIAEFVKDIESAISANQENNNTNSSKDYSVGKMLWLNDKLYKVIRNIDAGDTFIVGTNLELTNFEDLYNEFIEKVKHDICGNDDGGSPTATRSWSKGSWLWLNDTLYVVSRDIPTGNAYVFDGDNKNVRPITIEEMSRISYDGSTSSLKVNGIIDNDGTYCDKIQITTPDSSIKTVTIKDSDAHSAIGDLRTDVNAISNDVDNISNSVNKLNSRQLRTLYDYGFNGESDITSFVQAFLNDASADTLYMYGHGSYVINSLTIPNGIFKHFYKDADITLSGAGTGQLDLTTGRPKSEIYETYATEYNPYGKVTKNMSNLVLNPPTGATCMNATFHDIVLNENDGYYHWNICAISDFYQSQLGENCGEYIQVNNHAETHNWGLAIEVKNVDTSIANAQGGMRGTEIKLVGNGPSPGGNRRTVLHLVTDTNGTGFGIDTFLLINTGTANLPNGASYGILFTQGYYDRAFYLDNTARVSYGIDLSDCNIASGAIKVGSGSGHLIQYDNIVQGEAAYNSLNYMEFRRRSDNKTIAFGFDTDQSTHNLATYLQMVINGQTCYLPIYQ